MKKYENIYMKRFLYFNVYVIKGKDGDILIDTGFIGTKKALLKWLKNFNIKLIILTHAHIDHTWNVSYIKEKYNCKVALGKNDIKNLDNKNIKTYPAKKYLKLWTKAMTFGMKHLKSKPFKIDITLEDNQTIDKYGINLKIVELPGHTTGSIGILYKDYLFVGDALVNRRKISIAYQNQNNNKAQESLKKIINMKPKIIFLGHDKEFEYKKIEKKYI